MLYIAADHAGYQLKKYLVNYLKKQLQVEPVDLGAHEYIEEDDFSDFAFPLAQKVLTNPASRGILICGTGHGMCIVANKTKGARAIMGYSIEAAEKGRLEEDAQIICLAGRVLSDEHAAAIVKKFLETEFDGQAKRVRRLKKIAELEA
jgi:ribose 5-phosphate isomerase B